MIKEFPKIGLGTWELTKQKDIDTVIKAAYEMGYRHIDTAQIYLNERKIGKALQKSGIDRSKIFITSKIYASDYKGTRAFKAIKYSLKQLKTTYLDLILMHAPFTKTEYRIGTYKQFARAKKDGLVKRIGVSNFNIEQLKEFKKTVGEWPFCNQIVCSPTVRRTAIEKFCKENKIVLTGYSAIRPYYKPNQFYPGSALNTEQKEYIDGLANKKGKSPAQVMNRWLLQHGYHSITKTSKVSHLKENFDITNFQLTADEMQKIDSFNTTISDDDLMVKMERVMGSLFVRTAIRTLKFLRII